jgi:membrane fusion protein, multidrug efflux system
MERLSSLMFAVSLVALIGCDPITTSPKLPALQQQFPALDDSSVMEVPGRTQATPGRKGIIAPVPLHPVVEVLVAPGDRVKKGQALVKMDDDEARAEVQAKKAALESARIALQESRRYLGAVEKASQSGSLSEQKYHEIKVAALKAEMDERAARAMLESAQAELEHYVVSASIDGVVSRLDVNPGTVSRPGTTVWGEILDLSEIDVRCELTANQADRVFVGQTAEVRANGKKDRSRVGRVVFVGSAADKTSGLVPVVVRLGNPDGRLRCEMAVQVRLSCSVTN